MKYAKIYNDKVVETFVPLPGFTINDSFVPSIAMQFILVDDNVETGDDYVPPVIEEVVEENSEEQSEEPTE
jgi:hypothetical protein